MEYANSGAFTDQRLRELKANVDDAWDAYVSSQQLIITVERSESESGAIPKAFNMVHMLCSIHSARNCGLTSDSAKTLITKAAIAPTEASRDYYFKQLREEFPEKNCQDFENRQHEWSTVALLALGGHTNLGETNQNSSEQGHEADKNVRFTPTTESILWWTAKKSEKRMTRRLEADAMERVGRLVVPHATAKTLSQGKFMCFEYEGKIISFNGTVIIVDVSKKDRSGVHNVVTLDSSKTHDNGSLICECKYTEALGSPCHHGAYILLSLRELVEAYNITVKSGGKLPTALQSFSFLLPKWYHINYHVATYKAQYEQPVFVPTVGIHHPLFQLYPPRQKVPPGKMKKNRIKSKSEALRLNAQKTGTAKERATSNEATLTMVRTYVRLNQQSIGTCIYVMLYY